MLGSREVVRNIGGMILKYYIYCTKCDYKTSEHPTMMYAIAEIINQGGKFTANHNDDKCCKCKAKNSLKKSN